MPVSPVVRCVACSGTAEVAEVVVVLEEDKILKRHINGLCTWCRFGLALDLFDAYRKITEEVYRQEGFLLRVKADTKHVVSDDDIWIDTPAQFREFFKSVRYAQFVARLMADQPGT